MKLFGTILKIATALAAVAGAIYVVATYGDKIVAWAKNLLAKFSCCSCCCGEDDCCCEDECCCGEDDCCCDDECCCGEDDCYCDEAHAEETAPAEEAAEEAVHAEDADFEA